MPRVCVCAGRAGGDGEGQTADGVDTTRILSQPTHFQRRAAGIFPGEIRNPQTHSEIAVAPGLPAEVAGGCRALTVCRCSSTTILGRRTSYAGLAGVCVTVEALLPPLMRLGRNRWSN